MSARTPEEIADAILRKNGTTNRILPAIEEARGLMVEAARAAQEVGTLVVSTRDRQVRTGVTNNTVADLAEIIAGYVADGYTHEELVIEGVTE